MMIETNNLKTSRYKTNTWFISILLGAFLLWNVVFFYTDLWKIYLEPVGFHLWLQSIDWFQPYYKDLEYRIAQHPVNLDKYMVLLSWGAAMASGTGVLIVVYVFLDKKNMLSILEDKYKKKPIEGKVFLALIVAILLPFQGVYTLLTNYGELSTSSLGQHYHPSFFSLVMYFEFVFFGLVSVPPVCLWTIFALTRLKLNKTQNH